jgi:hypothetical protein
VEGSTTGPQSARYHKAVKPLVLHIRLGTNCYEIGPSGVPEKLELVPIRCERLSRNAGGRQDLQASSPLSADCRRKFLGIVATN